MSELSRIKKGSIATCPDCGHPLWVRGFLQSETKSLFLWCPKCRKRGLSKVTLINSSFERQVLAKLNGE